MKTGAQVKMNRRIVSTALTAGVLSMAASAQAQEFADQGTFIIAAERLFGFSLGTGELDPDGPGDIDYDETTFGLLGQRSYNDPSDLYSIPRVAFDYFVIDGLSVGGTIMFWTTSRDVEENEQDQVAFELAPRVGYAFMFADRAGIWPRGGLSFAHANTDFFGVGDDATLNSFAFNLEAPFVFTPADHVAILAGPAFDVAIAAGGEYDADPFEDDYDASILHFGLYAGMGMWF